MFYKRQASLGVCLGVGLTLTSALGGCSREPASGTKPDGLGSSLRAEGPAASSAAEKPNENAVFSSKEYRFSVSFPAKPEQSTSEVAGLRVHEFVARAPAKDGHEALFLIAIAHGEVDARDYLNHRPELLPKGINGKIQSLRRTQAGSHGGVEMVVVVNEGPTAYCVRYRSFAIDSKVYFVLCRTRDEESAKEEQAQRFFESFSVSNTTALSQRECQTGQGRL